MSVEWLNGPVAGGEGPTLLLYDSLGNQDDADELIDMRSDFHGCQSALVSHAMRYVICSKSLGRVEGSKLRAL